MTNLEQLEKQAEIGRARAARARAMAASKINSKKKTPSPKKCPRLFLSFSMGKSSAVMVEKVLKERATDYEEIIILCANTGREHEESLRYGEQCAARWREMFGIDVVLVEAVVNPEKRKGTRHRVVTWQTAHQGSEIFKAVFAKYGLANDDYIHCTRELKEAPMYSYIKNVLRWEKGSYDVAIGIRADEPKRLPKTPDFRKPFLNDHGGVEFYPLAQMQITRADVWRYCVQEMPFQLMIPEQLGNCIGCFKKCQTKLKAIIKDDPHALDYVAELEDEFKDAGAGSGDRKTYKPHSKERPGRRTARQMLADLNDPSVKTYRDDWEKYRDAHTAPVLVKTEPHGQGCWIL